VRREALEEVGGVPAIPLMEEFELCRKLRTAGRLAMAGATVETSARRFARFGTARTYWRMWSIAWRYYRGASPEELIRRYEEPTGRAAGSELKPNQGGSSFNSS
jgi:hypothetical protein